METHDEDQLWDFLTGDLPQERYASFYQHLASCPDCLGTLQALQDTEDFLCFSTLQTSPPPRGWERILGQQRQWSKRWKYLLASVAAVAVFTLGLGAGRALFGAQALSSTYSASSLQASSPWQQTWGEVVVVPQAHRIMVLAVGLRTLPRAEQYTLWLKRPRARALLLGHLTAAGHGYGVIWHSLPALGGPSSVVVSISRITSQQVPGHIVLKGRIRRS